MSQLRVRATLIVLLGALFLSACRGEEGVCHGLGTDGRDSCAALGYERACAEERRTWAPYLPGDKAERHWESSGTRTCAALGYAGGCGPGGCWR